MGLSEKEEIGIRGILAFMEPSSLGPLLSTITNGIVKTSKPQEATDCIVKYCKNTMDVLKRKRVTKDVLYRYLHQAGVEPKSDKIEMIRQCTQLWDTPPVSEVEVRKNDKIRIMAREEISETIHSAEPKIESPGQNVNSRYKNNYSVNNKKSKFLREETVDVETALVLAQYADWEMDESDDEPIVVSRPKPLPDDRLNDMGKTFVKWFYDLLKEIINPNLFGPHQFWPDCSLVLKQTLPNDQHESLTTSCCGSIEICNFVRHELTRSGLSFVPNTYVDPTTILDPSGLVAIQVSGVVHRCGLPCGVFTHQFGLIEDPSSQTCNWKIKSMHMEQKVSPPSEFSDISF
ncbi:uncharacterized protein C3orf38 homolog isoform X1 [Brevipalpus obovatus]|uniref:uncharacterized protein C3orf38 homolog isoform X1 n=1 Tax=Brevipalpus obovatus TaxID=246614 RepID=UPI003D9EA586